MTSHGPYSCKAQLPGRQPRQRRCREHPGQDVARRQEGGLRRQPRRLDKERRFHQLNSRADDTEAYAIAVFELAAAAADEAAQAALQALLARNDANLASLP